jgi:hypothetical protein
MGEQTGRTMELVCISFHIRDNPCNPWLKRFSEFFGGAGVSHLLLMFWES